VAPLVATYPLVTVVLSAIFLTHVQITPRLVIGVLITVAGVILILTG
jgi:drug/metabolite transporter (DMT)-like permease